MSDDDRLKKEEERLLRAMSSKERKPFRPAVPTPSSKPTTSFANSSAPAAPPTRSVAHPTPPSHSSTHAAPSAQLARTGSKVLSDEDIRKREEDMERERERLRALENNLVKNCYNAIGGETVSEGDAIANDIHRATAASRPTAATAAAPSSSAAKPPSIATQNKSVSAPGPHAQPTTSNDAASIEALLHQLSVAAGTAVPAKAVDSSLAKRQTSANAARNVLIATKSTVSSLLSASMARDPPSAQQLDDEMASYIRNIVGQVKPVQERGASISSPQFEFDVFARDVDLLVQTVMRDLHFFLQQADREQLAAHCDDLLVRALAVIDAAASSSVPVAEITTKQNSFVAALQKLIEALTAAAKRQIEMSASMRDAAHNLAECVQETAVYAQQIAEQLKQPLLEIQAFKESLTSMISAIKKAHQYVDSQAVKDSIMHHTKRVLEASLKLQSGDAEAATAHVDVLHEVTALLKTLMSLLKK